MQIQILALFPLCVFYRPFIIMKDNKLIYILL